MASVPNQQQQIQYAHINAIVYWGINYTDVTQPTYTRAFEFAADYVYIAAFQSFIHNARMYAHSFWVSDKSGRFVSTQTVRYYI